MDKQAQEGASSSISRPKTIGGQATRVPYTERRPSAVPAASERRGARLRRTNGGRLTDGYSAIPPHTGSQTYRRSATQTGHPLSDRPQRSAMESVSGAAGSIATGSVAADHAASATGSAITDAAGRDDRSTIGFFEKFRKKLSLILIEAEPLGGFCPE